jgi:pyruvate kinase
MIAAGVNIFRLNCSHRRGGDFERVYPLIRKTAAEMGVKVEILGDLQGPKFRVGELADGPITVGKRARLPTPLFASATRY